MEEINEFEQYSVADEEFAGFLSDSATIRPLGQQIPLLENQPSASIYNADQVQSTVAKVLDEWKLSSPDICLTFVSGTRSFTSWKNEDHRAALQEGIIKLMNSTETWIIDNGIDYGCAKLVGNAVQNELQFRRSRRDYEVYARGYLKQKRHSVMLMGVVPAALLSQHERPQLAEPTEAVSDADNTFKFDVNPSHSHYVYIRTNHQDSAIIRANFVTELVSQAGARKSPAYIVERASVEKDGKAKVQTVHQQVPLIVLLIQGGEMALNMICQYVKNGVPILVLKDTGFMADILAFSSQEYKARGSSPSALQTIRKDISERLMTFYPDLNREDARKAICHRIMDCVVTADNGERQLITVVDCSEDLVNLDNYFLPAIFSARPPTVNALKQQVRSDFLLTMKLNKPAIAESKVMGRNEQRIFEVDNELFEKALLWKGREKFVEKFMEEDFVVHQFLSHSQLLRLFRKAEDTDFFITVVWNQIPRHHFDQRIEESFVTRDLNLIVEKLASVRNFLSMHELSSSFLGQYVSDPYTAERKALNALMVWAVLMNRYNLAKSLWKFCEDPIPIALFISALYRGLAKHCPDSSLVDDLRKASKAFSCMAIDVLDMSYKESGARTFNLLNQKFVDFNNLTPIKVAYMSENRYFLAHEACQIWLNRLWSGGIEVTSSWNSIMPSEVKLVLSALFIFPIYFWIQYPRKNFAKDVSRHVDKWAMMGRQSPADTPPGQEHLHPGQQLDRFHIPSVPERLEMDGHRTSQNYAAQLLRGLKEVESRHQSHFERNVHNLSHNNNAATSNPSIYADAQLPLWKKVYYLWSAPRTKFWMCQVMYWLYLATFSIAVVLPTCNHLYLDVVILIWTLLNVCEMISRTAYQQRRHYPVNVFRRCIEVGLMTSWVMCIVLLKTYVYAVRAIYYSRVLMCCGLLYMYYRMATVFFPINPTLGPMLYRFKKMMTQDFYTFARLATPFILANMFVLQAVMYPDLPFGVETLRKGFYRAFFTLFISFVAEFDYTQKCEATRIRSSIYSAASVNNNETDRCWVGDYEDHRCPTLGVATYVLNVQFLVIMRLILLVLLNALFAATAIRVKEEADAIFKYERYRTVLDFASRSVLPPPFSVLNYAFNWLLLCCHKVRPPIQRQRTNHPSNPPAIQRMQQQSNSERSYESYSYWMGLTKEYYRKRAADEKDKKTASDQLNRIKSLQSDTKSLKAKLSRLMEEVIEKDKKNSYALLQDIGLMLDRRGLAREEMKNPLSRTSPYPATNLQRLALLSFTVAWQYDGKRQYDAPAYSKPVTVFPAEEQPFVDDIIMQDNALCDQLDWHWNNIAERNGIKIDRRSWVEGVDGPTDKVLVKTAGYSLNLSAVPQNPSGRTGLGGRGSLHRYGPNHSIMLMLSRNMEDQLSFLIAKKSTSNELSSLFPTKLILDGQSAFASAVQLLQSLFEGAADDVAQEWSEANAASLCTAFECIVFGAQKKQAKLLDRRVVYTGYFDHPQNTDNAWRELMVLHVHIHSWESIAALKTDVWTWDTKCNMQGLSSFEEDLLASLTLSGETNEPSVTDG